VQDKEPLHINKTANKQRIVRGKSTKHIVSENNEKSLKEPKDLLENNEKSLKEQKDLLENNEKSLQEQKDLLDTH